jgi:hypothetical protein
MSIVLFCCAAASAAAVGWVSGRRAREEHERTLAATPPAPEPPPNPFAAFPYSLGDVILRTQYDEALLRGGLRLSEGGAPVAAIFFGAGERGVTRIVMVFAGSKPEAFWLKAETGTQVSAEPPSSLPVGESFLERKRRLPVKVESFGDDVPSFDPEALFAEYRGGAGQGAVVLRGTGSTLVAAGDVVSRDILDRLPGS